MFEPSLARRPPSRRRIGWAVLLAGLLPLSAAIAKDTRSTIELPGDLAFPEAITSTADGTLYVSSLGNGGIFRARPGETKATEWIAPGTYGTRSTFGVLADEKAGLLWVCSNDISAVIGPHVAGDETGAWLKGFDLKTGEGKVSAKFPNERALCNDIALGPDGGVYATNTMAPEIVKLSADRKTLTVWATDPRFGPTGKDAGLDGIVFGGDGHVYVNTYSKAELFRVEAKNGKAGTVTPITPSRPLVLPDTLRLIEGTTFWLIEGGGRLDRMTIEGDTAKIETIKDGFALPTGITQVGRNLAWVSEGQLDLILDPSKRASTKPSLPFKLHAVPLESK
jgi:streptogramin lyase